MDRMKAMEAFVEAVKQRSLGAAAQSLGISRTIVSRHIQALEADLGVRLMNRTTRSLTLTDAGQGYFHQCDDILSRITEMNRYAAGNETVARGEVSVLAPKWMQSSATRMVVDFAKANTEIRPRLVLGGMAQTAYGFLEQGCDIALHTRRIPDSRITARRITDIPFSLCAAPGYLTAAGPLERPADLLHHAALMQYNYHTWQFRKGGREERVQPSAAFSANTFPALRDAAIEGLGIVLAPKPVVRDDLASGRLVEVLADWQPYNQTLYIAQAPGKGTPTRVRMLLDFAIDWYGRNGI